MNEDDLEAKKPKRRRGKLLGMAGGAFAVAGLAYLVYWYVDVRNFERTDDAYVQGNLVQITPQVSGTVIAVNADDTDFVKAGAPLVALDRSDAEVAVAQAQAALAQTVREVRSLYTTNATGSANVTLREAEVARARADLAKAQDDLNRRQVLVSSGAVSGEELNHAQSGVSNAAAALAAAQAALVAAQQQLATSRALTDGATVETHPNVERAAAKLREQYLDYARTVLPAPVSGYVAKRTVQVGQRIAPGAPLMSIVPLDQVWVDANFKELQLRHMRIGQPVTLTADAYGTSIVYHGKVAGLGVGTGSAFALLPAQNATGNWIKVVQRVPVRIALDPAELAQHPLRVGLSTEVSVNVADTSGGALADAPRANTAYATNAFERNAEEADALVRETIAVNLGRAPAKAEKAPVAKLPAAPNAATVQHGSDAANRARAML
ncbi:MAG TPA: efflux RND transporter periplasmic adaptor subunit [Casimicrobiaceae bacterium]|nr:efflux RND transporter periplasmic adaptor subunit [Casimicrobiaceae bacterium]